VFRSQIHYHSIWRDRARDYGGNFYTTVLGTRDVTAASVFGVYPSPITAGSSLQLQLMAPATTASYTLRNLLGQTIAHDSFKGSTTAVPTAGLAPGTYLMSVKTPTQQEVTSRVQVY
ncbi:MAG: T9SS type A sorting domain-containing protein, partial [Hymenobacter sp.]